MSRKLGAQGRRRNKAARRPRRPRSRCRCAGSARASLCCSSALSVQPVGLFGALTSSTLVRSVTASSSRCRSSTQGTAAHGRSGRRTTLAPMIVACAVRLGHTGTTATTSSPAPASTCIASISALTPRRRDGDAVRRRRGHAARSCTRRAPRAVRAGRGCVRRRSRRQPATSPRRRAPNAGVASSLSPNQKASTSSRPMPASATSRIFEARERGDARGCSSRALEKEKAAARWSGMSAVGPPDCSKEITCTSFPLPVILLRSCAAFDRLFDDVFGAVTRAGSQPLPRASRAGRRRDRQGLHRHARPARRRQGRRERVDRRPSRQDRSQGAERRRKEGRRPHRLSRAFDVAASRAASSCRARSTRPRRARSSTTAC